MACYSSEDDVLSWTLFRTGPAYPVCSWPTGGVLYTFTPGPQDPVGLLLRAIWAENRRFGEASYVLGLHTVEDL